MNEDSSLPQRLSPQEKERIKRLETKTKKYHFLRGLPVPFFRKKWKKNYLKNKEAHKILMEIYSASLQFHFSPCLNTETKINILLTNFNDEEIKTALPLLSFADQLSQKTGIFLRIACLSWAENEYLPTWRLLKKTIKSNWEFYCSSPSFLNNRSFHLEMSSKDIFLTTSVELFKQLCLSRLPVKIIYLSQSHQDVLTLMEEKSWSAFHVAYRECILFIRSESLSIIENGKTTFPENFSIFPVPNDSKTILYLDDAQEQRLTNTSL